MHHEEGIQHLTLGQLKPQLGFIKEERKVPHFPTGNWQMEDVYCLNMPNSSACYFYYIPSTTTWFKANANYSCISVISGAEIQPATKKYTDVFPHILVPLCWTPTLWYCRHIICFCAIFSIITTAHPWALQGFTLLTKAIKLSSGNLAATGADLKGNESKLSRVIASSFSKFSTQDLVIIMSVYL